MSQVICFGELLVDMVSSGTDVSLGNAPSFLKAPGGAPANVAAGLKRLGTQSRFVGQVGDDPFGHWLAEILRNENVDTDFLRYSRHSRTTIAFVATRSDGRKDVCFYRNPGADAQLKANDLNFRMFDGARLFHCGGVSLSMQPCREAQMKAATEAKALGLLVSFDPNWRPTLWENHDQAREVLWDMLPLSDIVKVAEEEWQFFTGTENLREGAAQIIAAGPRLLIVTLGSEGAYFYSQQSEGYVTGFSAQVVDTLGAGDSFMAGLLHYLLSQPTFESCLTNDKMHEALRFANACGGLATQKVGAISALPSFTEAEVFLALHSDCQRSRDFKSIDY